MDYQQFPYSDSVPSWRMDMTFGILDPDSKRSSGFMDPWNTQQRFYNESSKVIYTPETTLFYNSSVNKPDEIIPHASARFPRHSSPSDHQSSTSSSASPLDESEYSHDQFPSTPPDDLDISPAFHSHVDSWGSQEQLYELSGLYVKPDEVNYCQELCVNHGEDKSPEFISRGFSMSSQETNYDLAHGNQPEDMMIPRQMSPIDFCHGIKEEIETPEDVDKNDSYPPLEPSDDDGDEGASEEDEPEDPLPIIIQDDRDDGDYKPRSQRKRQTTSHTSRTSNSNRGRKRASTSRQGSQTTKKQKLESNISNNKTASKIAVLKSNFACPECCGVAFGDESSLEKHVKQQHTRPFICVFSFAGCNSTFAAKNEWKRHVLSQHLLLNYWLCQQDGCCKESNSSSGGGSDNNTATPGRNRFNNTSSHHSHSSSSSLSSSFSSLPGPPDGAVFNRKDLFTQHVRRMHVPIAFKKQIKQKKGAIPEWEERVRSLQENAYKQRCQLPHHMACPAPTCPARFNGVNAWDEYMEHAAKHLEKAAVGAETPLVFGGDGDATLVDWAASREVSVIIRLGDEIRNGWQLCNPLKPERNSLGRKVQVVSAAAAVDDDDVGDEDAEGEEVDE